MSWLAHAWAEDAPVADVQEFAILAVMAQHAHNDGTGTYQSIPTISRRIRCDERTVLRRVEAMRERGLLTLGDQSLAGKIRADRRPKVYDILIPYEWYSDHQRGTVDAERADRGLPPLAEAERPPIAKPEPARKVRDDAGKPRPKRTKPAVAPPESGSSRGDYKTPREAHADDHGVTSSPIHGVSSRHPILSLQEIQSANDRHSAADASPSTSPLTDQNQDIDRWRAPSPRQRGADPRPNKDPIDLSNPDVWDQVSTPELVQQVFGQIEKQERLTDLIADSVSGLHPNEEHLVEAMLERGEYWQKICYTIWKQRGYAA